MDEEWHAVEVEPETVEVHRNGTGIVVETAAANGHADVVEETQQSMFSWAEFMAEEPQKAGQKEREAEARDPLDVRVGAQLGGGKRGSNGVLKGAPLRWRRSEDSND